MMQKRIRLEERSKTYIILNQSHATEHINTQKINTAFINGKTKVGENNFQFYFFLRKRFRYSFRTKTSP
ncbi:hypothetical protein HMPREF0765_1641 [Sphingobacterium spiritivorum ATCC 33300]|uniref:Uncharacterized protein n=1 Tax=Sphingobacterium spiritivorum ATCC 33300 TaxID=525372 RepID=C2FWD5_SPHSI|nr:hypothetical protein HMPREF0765_1641 [Sphingobacterium spiritivorum ATCC 33300]